MMKFNFKVSVSIMNVLVLLPTLLEAVCLTAQLIQFAQILYKYMVTATVKECKMETKEESEVERNDGPTRRCTGMSSQKTPVDRSCGAQRGNSAM